MDVGTWLREAKGWVDSLDADLIALNNFAPEGADRSWLVSNNVVKIRGKGAALPARPLAGDFATRIQLFSFVRTRNEENEQKMKASKNGKSPQKPPGSGKGK